MDQQPARRVRLSNGNIFIETAILTSCGITDSEAVFHAAGGQCYSAVISNKKITVTIDSDGVNTDFGLMKIISHSIFLK